MTRTRPSRRSTVTWRRLPLTSTSYRTSAQALTPRTRFPPVCERLRQRTVAVGAIATGRAGGDCRLECDSDGGQLLRGVIRLDERTTCAGLQQVVKIGCVKSA